MIKAFFVWVVIQALFARVLFELALQAPQEFKGLSLVCATLLCAAELIASSIVFCAVNYRERYS